jgi:hypothetical protein
VPMIKNSEIQNFIGKVFHPYTVIRYVWLLQMKSFL